MTTLLSASQKLKLRSDGHRSKFYLSVIQPATLLSGLVNNGSITRGAVSIDFDNGTAADTALIQAGQTLTVTLASGKKYSTTVVSFSSAGSSPAIAGTITVDANAIAWENNAALVIYDNYEPRAIPPTFDNGTGISKKRGQVWSSQTTTDIPPVARLGPHRTGFSALVLSLAGDGAALQPGASIASYAWASTIGTIAAPASQNTTLTVNTPGQGWLSLTVTDSGGNTHTGRRRIFAHSTDPDNANYPYVDFSVSSVGTAWDGSATAEFEVFGVADFAQFIDGALVVLWKQDWYGDEAGAVGLGGAGDDILFAGYMIGDSIQQDWNNGTVSFRAGNIIEVLKQLPMQGLSIHAESNPAYWFQYHRQMTIARALHWLWYWHSTLFEVADVHLPGYALYKKLYKFNEGSLYSQGQGLADSIFARVTASRAGIVYVEQDVQALDAAGRAAISELTEVTSSDWRGQLTIPRRHKKQQAGVKLRGYHFDGETLTPYCSIAPSKIRDDSGGSPASYDGIVVDGQAMANLYSGRLLAGANNDIAEVRLAMAGNYAVIDVAPQYWLTMDLASGDTPRGLTWADQRLVPRQVVHNIDVVSGLLTTDVICEAEALGPDGVSELCPDVPDAEVEDAPWTGTEPALAALVAFSSTHFRDDNASDWTSQSAADAAYGCKDVWWPLRQGSTNPLAAILWRVDGGEIWRSLDAGETWSDVTPAANPPDTWSDSPAPGIENVTFVGIFSDPWNQGRFFSLARWQNGSSLWRGWLVYTENDGAAWAWVELYDGVSLPDGIKPLWLAVNGTYVLVTCWEDDTTDILRLLSFDAETLDYDAKFSLGEASEAELNALDYVAYPLTVLDDDDLWVIFGRMNAPQSLDNPEHIIKTTDAGSGWSSVDKVHGTGYVSALDVSLLDGSDRVFSLTVVP